LYCLLFLHFLSDIFIFSVFVMYIVTLFVFFDQLCVPWSSMWLLWMWECEQRKYRSIRIFQIRYTTIRITYKRNYCLLQVFSAWLYSQTCTNLGTAFMAASALTHTLHSTIIHVSPNRNMELRFHVQTNSSAWSDDSRFQPWPITSWECYPQLFTAVGWDTEVCQL
jgi:hypothetical protein